MSYKKTASQSITAIGPYFDAYNAVDRNFTTCMRTQAIGFASPYRTTWWKVDLGGVYNIYSVNIFFKNYGVYGIFIPVVLNNNADCLTSINVYKLCRYMYIQFLT